MARCRHKSRSITWRDLVVVLPDFGIHSRKWLELFDQNECDYRVQNLPFLYLLCNATNRNAIYVTACYAAMENRFFPSKFTQSCDDVKLQPCDVTLQDICKICSYQTTTELTQSVHYNARCLTKPYDYMWCCLFAWEILFLGAAYYQRTPLRLCQCYHIIMNVS